jgi:hypothetical protein
MVDLGVALTWMVISAASAKGLSAFARAVASNEIQEELAAGMRDDRPARDDRTTGISSTLRPAC